MTVGRVAILLIVSVSCFFSANAQKTSKSALQREKQKNLERIKETEKILNETAARKKNSLGELTALKQRIEQQENLITSIKGEVGLLDNEISENNDIIRALEDDLDKLKKEYAALLYAAQKANSSTTRLSFLFSAESFDQLIMRLRYMEQYSATRKLQAEQITKVQQELGGQVKEIEARRAEKNKLLMEEVAENDNLTNLKKKQGDMIKSLSREEKKLKRDLENTKKAVAQIDKMIEEIVREEAAKAARSTNKSSATIALSSSFEQNKKQFPWPVASGFISQKFGRQNHPVLKGIVVQNNGVNIQTKQNEKVKCIFDGEVSRVAFIQTMGNTVIIKHGDYLTVYAGLKDVTVRTGQKVSTNQEIGTVLSNTEGVSELRFQIFKSTTPLDPQTWLRAM